MLAEMLSAPNVSHFGEPPTAGTADPSTVYALDAIIARSFMHRRLWLNDPDCLMLRARETRLTADERAALAAVIGASGGMLLISDDMALLGEEEGELFRTVAKISAKIDSNAAQEPILALDLMATGDVRGMVNENENGTIAMLLNRADSPARVSGAPSAPPRRAHSTIAPSRSVLHSKSSARLRCDERIKSPISVRRPASSASAARITRSVSLST